MDMINEIGRWLQEKEVLPTALERLGMADKLAEIVLISLGITVLLGILSCFFGLKLARFWFISDSFCDWNRSSSGCGDADYVR